MENLSENARNLLSQYQTRGAPPVATSVHIRNLRASDRLQLFASRIKAHVDNIGANSTYSRPLTFTERAMFSNEGNTKAILGDKYVNEILKTLTEFSTPAGPFQLRDEQMGIIAHCIAGNLPYLYGDALEANKERLLTKLNIEKIKELVFILAGRRVGKTTTIGAYLASVMIVVPKVTIAVIANVWRNAKRIKDVVVDFLFMHPRGSAMFARKPGFPIPINNSGEICLYGKEPHEVKRLTTYPDEPNGSKTDSVVVLQKVDCLVGNVTPRRFFVYGNPYHV